jgi:hypothetical protein
MRKSPLWTLRLEPSLPPVPKYTGLSLKGSSGHIRMLSEVGAEHTEGL